MKPCDRSIILLTLIHLIAGGSIYAQLTASKLYTIAEGLPSTETERCFVSSDGRLWSISTQSSLAVYDGQRFKPRPETLALGINSRHSFFEDQHGIWLLAPGSGFLLQGEKWKKIKVPKDAGYFINRKGKNQLFLLNEKLEYFQYQEKSQSYERVGEMHVPEDGLSNGLGRIFVNNIADTSYFVKRKDGENGFGYLYKDIDDTHPEKVDIPANSHVTPITDSLWLLTIDNKDELHDIRWIKPGGELAPITGTNEAGEKVLFKQVHSQIHEGNLWLIRKHPKFFGRAQDNIYEIWKMDEDHIFHPYSRFPLSAPSSVLTMTQDKADNIWIPSHSGLLRIYPYMLFCAEDHPNMVGGIHVLNEDKRGNIWFGSYQNGFAKYNGFQIESTTAQQLPYKKLLPGTWRDEEGFMHFFTEIGQNGWFKTDGETWVDALDKPYPAGYRFTGYYFHPLANGQLAAGLTRKGLGIASPPFIPGNNWKIIGQEKGLALENVLTITEDKAGRLWCGRSSQGIAIYDPKQDTAVTWLRQEGRGLGAISSTLDSRDNLWLGTQNGIAWLKQPEQFDYLNQDINDHLLLLDLPGLDDQSNKMVTFLKEHEGYLVFGNMSGFGLLDLNSFYESPDHTRVFFYNTLRDYPGRSAEQNAILIDKEKNIWMGNDLGALKIDWSKLVLDTTQIYLAIKGAITGKGDTLKIGPGDAFKLPRTDRNLTVNFEIQGNRTLQPGAWLSYSLLVDGLEDNIQAAQDFLQDEQIHFGYLPAGNHKLVINLFKNNQIHHTDIITITVPKTLEESTWFWVGISILILGLISYFRFRQLRREQRYQLEKEQLQVEAIVSSLNPHFINNTLHWLQAKVARLVQNKQDENAISVIDRLAKNIHILFRRSRYNQPYHTLAEEMELVKNYLYIQENRFGGRYQYQLPTTETISQYAEVQVPLMQIQIHVENAIEHGLRNREGASYVKVELRDDQAYLTIIIEDDGIGISNAKKIKSRGTQQGTKMLESLHKIFNSKNKLQISTTIEESLYINSNSTAFGTRISIGIPKYYNYEFKATKSASS